MLILDCEQYSTEWWAARAGIPTASGADRILTAGGKPSSSADAYIAELVDEVVRPIPERSQDERAGTFSGNRHTERGHELEPKAAAWHHLVTGLHSRPVGLVLRDSRDAACSPDRLIGDRGGLEIKAPEGKKHALWMIQGVLPAEHRQQVHFSLAVTGLDFWDFVSYCPGYKPFRVRVTPDNYTEKMAAAIDDFVIRLDAAKAQFIDYINEQKETA